MEEAILLDRLPFERPATSEAFVVDGWLCPRCETTSFPRPCSVEQSVAWGQRGAEHARNGEFSAAEWWFVRIASAWPHYLAADLDLATAHLGWSQLARSRSERDEFQQRALGHLQRGLRSFELDPVGNAPAAAAHLIVTLAELQVELGAWEEARETLRRIYGLEMKPNTAAQLERLTDHLATEPEIFGRASEIISPHLQLDGAPGRPILREERAKVSAAVDELEQHHARHGSWRSLWFAAKGRESLGESEQSLALWRRAEAAHGDVRHVAVEAVLSCLTHGHLEEAQAMARRSVDHIPADAGLWANLAITELLLGHFVEAHAAVAQSLELDASDEKTRALKNVLERCQKRGTHPRSLNELMRS